ncbi:MAG: ATP-binding cassette domain-containing protein [Deltaproteobacteria bacterium]|nr:ATP-binding cassette domain-containing protein [Deltaproteobacteria bacterium]
MIEVEHLSKSYGTHRAVDDLSFAVAKGEVVGFLGPNGAGKSTTLRMLTGFLPPTAGRIRIDGLDMLSAPVEAKKRIGYMPEACPLYGEMRVDEYLRYRAELKGVPSRSIVGRVGAALEMASVKEVAGRIIGQLSKGTRQRVGLADALVADPPLLVLDEPTAGLDPNQIRSVRDVIKSLAGHKTVLLSTHILPEVEASCGRVVIIHRGKLVREGAPDQIRSMGPGSSVMLVSKSDESVLLAALRAIEGVVEVVVRDRVDGTVRCEVRAASDDGAGDLSERVFSAIAKAGLTLRELRETKGASLEDVFSALTTAEPSRVETKPDDSAADAAKPDSNDDEPKGDDAAKDEEAAR